MERVGREYELSLGWFGTAFGKRLPDVFSAGSLKPRERIYVGNSRIERKHGRADSQQKVELRQGETTRTYSRVGNDGGCIALPVAASAGSRGATTALLRPGDVVVKEKHNKGEDGEHEKYTIKRPSVRQLEVGWRIFEGGSQRIKNWGQNGDQM